MKKNDAVTPTDSAMLLSGLEMKRYLDGRIRFIHNEKEDLFRQCFPMGQSSDKNYAGTEKYLLEQIYRAEKTLEERRQEYRRFHQEWEYLEKEQTRWLVYRDLVHDWLTYEVHVKVEDTPVDDTECLEKLDGED